MSRKRIEYDMVQWLNKGMIVHGQYIVQEQEKYGKVQWDDQG